MNLIGQNNFLILINEYFSQCQVEKFKQKLIMQYYQPNNDNVIIIS